MHTLRCKIAGDCGGGGSDTRRTEYGVQQCRRLRLVGQSKVEVEVVEGR